jgi:hypothetical protein
MTITIYEILTLKKFNNFQLIAGANGLDRIVSRGGFIDHEMPEEISNNEYKNEMIFSNLALAKNNPEQIVKYIEALYKAESACFAIKTTFFNKIQNTAIETANKLSFPLFLFDDTYIEELILEIDQEVNSKKQELKKIEIIKEIETSNLNAFKIKELAYELNHYFKPNYVSIYVRLLLDIRYSFSVESARKILNKHALIIPIKSSYLIILSFDKNEKISLIPLLNNLGLNETHCNIGISREYNELGNINKSFHESKISLKYSIYKEKYIANYNELGIYQILFPITDNQYSHMYFEDILQKLKLYDDEHHSNLVDTACAYIHSDGDIKLTSEELFQHMNTIRYRIRKIKVILNFQSLTGMQYESLATAIHLYELNKKRFKFDNL